MSKPRHTKTKTERQNERLIKHSSSEKVSICESCNKPFEQIYNAKTNTYSNFKRCRECITADATGERRVTLAYTPHETQQIFHESEARFKILQCGNRWGKDLGAIAESVMKFVEMGNEERSIDINPPVLWWIVAPTMKMARQNWRDLKKLLPVEVVQNISVTDMTIETINGGIVEVHSADDPEALVGVGLDLVTITEAARVRD